MSIGVYWLGKKNFFGKKLRFAKKNDSMQLSVHLNFDVSALILPNICPFFVEWKDLKESKFFWEKFTIMRNGKQ